MVSKSKLYSKLDGLESELQERIVPHLVKAAEGKNDLVFCVNGYHSFTPLKYKTDSITAEPVAIGTEILSLRQKLGEPIKGSIAERICWYCREWGNTKNYYRDGTQELEKQLLSEIENT